ncbi:hypothetical protein ABK040_001719 [Willaertia magna]
MHRRNNQQDDDNFEEEPIMGGVTNTTSNQINNNSNENLEENISEFSPNGKVFTETKSSNKSCCTYIFMCSLLCIISISVVLFVIFFILSKEDSKRLFETISTELFSTFSFEQRRLFKKLKEEGNVLRFVVIGDFGRRGLLNQTEVAQQMEFYCENFGCDFAISTGDNFYPSGVKDVNDEQFKSSFENVYESVDAPIWFMILGNHDYRSNPKAQIAYTSHSRNKGKFYLPNEYYIEELEYKNKNLENTNFKAQFLFFDTQPFIQRYYFHPKMNKTALAEQKDTKKQLKYIEGEMYRTQEEENFPYTVNNNKKKENDIPMWRISIGHHPMLSASTHQEDGGDLIENLLPFLSKHGISIYFSGHDHSLQYLHKQFSPKNMELHQFISGAGSAVRYDVNVKHKDLKLAQQDPGFLYCTLSKDVLEVSFVNMFGKITSQIKIGRK